MGQSLAYTEDFMQKMSKKFVGGSKAKSVHEIQFSTKMSRMIQGILDNGAISQNTSILST